MKIFILYLLIFHKVIASYWDVRKEFVEKEEKMRLGSNIILNEREQIANDVLSRKHSYEIWEGMKNPKYFPASKHFFNGGKELIENSTFFEVFKKLPKGIVKIIFTISSPA